MSPMLFADAIITLEWEAQFWSVQKPVYKLGSWRLMTHPDEVGQSLKSLPFTVNSKSLLPTPNKLQSMAKLIGAFYAYEGWWSLSAWADALDATMKTTAYATSIMLINQFAQFIYIPGADNK